MIKSWILFCATCIVNSICIFAQPSQTDTLGNNEKNYLGGSSVRRAMSTKYNASPSEQFFWGKHYRKEWATVTSFPILNMKTEKGGLTPDKLGGGHQSKTLRVMGADGKEYSLKSMDKCIDALIPEHLKGTFLHKRANDQLSMIHPYGALIVARLSEYISVLHTNPKLVYVPHAPELGKFRDSIGNMICLFEERPSGEGWAHDKLTGNADDVDNSEKLIEKVEKDTKYRIDQKELLKLRLFDMVINDWDRHEDQWSWAEHKGNPITTYRPFAKDRDHAFSRIDGLIMHFVSMPWALRPLSDMDRKVKDVLGHNFSARNLDRQFLNEPTKEDWEKTISDLQSSLSDEAIKDALSTVPPEVNKYSGNFLYKKLRQRRDNLPGYGMKYYRKLNKYVTIAGSAKDEHFNLVFLNEGMSVTGLRNNKDTFYHRVFYPSQTKEVNIYGLDSSDTFTFSGDAKNKFIVRIIGGDENDKYEDERKESGKKIRIYDTQEAIDVPANKYRVNQNEDTLFNYKRDAVKYDWYLPFVIPGYNPDDGVYFALGFTYRKQRWGKTPFAWEQTVKLEAATATGFVGFGYRGLFKHTFGRWDLDLEARYRGPKFVFNYYGTGNETELVIKDKNFYRTGLKALSLNPGISRTTNHMFAKFGLTYDEVRVLNTPGKFISSDYADIDSTIFVRKHFGGLTGIWHYTTTDLKKNPRRGVNLDGGFTWRDNLDNTQWYVNLHGAVSFYFPIGRTFVFAHRTGGATNFGDYDIYFGNTLGRSENLRGFWRYRFNGRTSFYQNTELRMKLSRRGNFGMLGFVDDGRVWVKDEESNTIHVGYGAGFYFVPFNAVGLNVSYAKSKEASMILVKAGFLF